MALFASLAGLMFMACAVPSSEEELEGLAEAAEPITASSDFYCGYPTKWTLSNTTSSTLTFTCTCPKPVGLVSPINMPATTVAGGASTVFSWSAFHNDGLGLNACNWSCTAKQTDGAVFAQKSFFSNWGECMTISATSGGTLNVQF